MPITNGDFALIRAAKSVGALDDVKNHLIQSPKGTIPVLCPDCDQFLDIYPQHCKQCGGSRHHPLCLNGGALLLSPYSSVRGAKTDGKVLLRHIKVAAGLKGITTVALYVHAPCGVARNSGFDFLEVMRHEIEGKNLLRHTPGVSRLTIVCFVHVDYNGQASSTHNGKKRTYFVNRTRMTEFLKDHGRPVRS